MSDVNEIPLNAIDRHVGSRLRTRRLFCQMSEEWLAGQLEVSLDKMAAFEKGSARISYEMLTQAAEMLDVPERYFYMGLGGAGGGPNKKKSWLREVDRWFRDYVSPHEGLFLKAARHLTGNLDAARDLVHDAYAAVLSDERWRTVENPRAYVRRAVTNLALDRLKRKKIVQIDDYAEVEMVNFADAAPDAYQTLAGRERLGVVMAALDRLPPQCRQVFIMRKIEDVSPTEIAARLGIEIKTVEGHLARGLVALNKHLETAAGEARGTVRLVKSSGLAVGKATRGGSKEGPR